MNPWRPSHWSISEDSLADASLPFITLGVLNYNRREALRQTLDVLVNAVQYPNYEIIVIDNGSTDGSTEMVLTEFPGVILNCLAENRGVSSRNLQPKISSGKYLFSFDNDSIPATPATVLNIVQHMEAHTSIDALSCLCYQPYSGLEETAGWPQFRLSDSDAAGIPGLFVVEGGICFRVEILQDVEGYDPSFLYGSEGMDLALQLYKKKARIYLNPNFAVLHFHASRANIQASRYYANARNIFWMLAKHWPIVWLLFLWPLWIVRRTIGGFLHPTRAIFELKGLFDGLRGCIPFVDRTPKLSFFQAVNLRRFYLFLFRW